MSKLKGFMFAMLLLFVAPILGSCAQSGTVIRVDGISLPVSYTIAKDATLQLEPVITPVEATNHKVTWSVVSGNEYITLSNTGLVTALSAGEAEIRAISDDGKYSAKCTITVRNDPIVLAAPTGLQYNPTTKVVTWNAVTNSLNDFRASYQLSIEKDGAPAEITNTLLTTKSITVGGQYRVTVKAIGDTILFNDSTTTEYSFRILQTPATPVVTGGVLSAVAVEGIDTAIYKLSVMKMSGSNAVALPTEDQALFNAVIPYYNSALNVISWEIPQGLSPATYQFKVRIAAGEVENLFDSSYSSTTANATFTQLAAPTNMIVDAGVLSWNAITGAAGYQIEVYDEDDELKFTYTSSTGNSYALPAEATDLVYYAVKMKTLGNGSATLSSVLSSATAQQKLIAPTNLSVKSVDGLELSWDMVANASSYEVLFAGKDAINYGTFTTVTEGDTARAFLNISPDSLQDMFTELTLGVGQIAVQIRAKPIAGSASYIASDNSASLMITKLRAPNLSTKEGNISWNEVANSTNFAFKIVKDSTTVFEENLDSFRNNYIMDTSYAAGEYNVEISAIGNGTDILDSDISERTFTRLAVPTGLAINSDGLISWALQTGQNLFELVITKTEDYTVSTIRLSEPSYSVKNYLEGHGFGEYYFSVRALNNVASEAKINSNLTENITGYKLTAPDGLQAQNGMVTWSAVTGMKVADSTISDAKYQYEITIGGSTFITSSLSVLPTNISAGSYSVKIRTVVKGSNKFSDSIYLLPSDYATGSITATKLATPTSLAISAGTLSWGKVTNATKYQVTTKWKDVNPTLSETFEINSPTDTSLAISTIMDRYDEDSIEYRGVCYITIRALGTGGFLSSDLSAQTQVFKLTAPTLEVKDGQLSWNKVYSEYNSMQIPAGQYTLQVNAEADFNGTVDGNGYSIEGTTVQVSTGTYAGSYIIAENAVSIGGVNYFLKDGRLFREESSFYPTETATTWALTGYAGGNYLISVKAGSGSTSGTVIESSDSVAIQAYKLSKVDSTTFAGYSSSGKNNGVSWSPVTAAGISVSYQLTVNEIELDGRTTLRHSVPTQINYWYIFGDDLIGSDYRLQVRAISTDNYVINADYTDALDIKRLARVAPLAINASTEVSWVSSTGADGYRVYLGETPLSLDKVDSVNRKITMLGGDNPVLEMGEDGTFSVRVVAVTNKTGSAALVGGKLTISAAPSETLTIIRYKSAALSVSNGKISWTNSNLTNYGYRLTFDSGVTTVTVDLPQNSSSYDMSAAGLIAGTQYTVSIVARGNSGSYLNSPSAALLGAYVIRLSAPEWRVEGGILVWDKATGASSYTVRTSDSLGSTKTNTGISGTVGSTTISYLPSAASGTLKFTIQAMGSVAAEGGNFYVDSLVSTTQSTVNKLAAPSDLTVMDGEIVWNRPNTQVNIGGQNYTTISEYMVSFGGSAEKVGTAEDFFLSEFVSTTQRNISVRVSAIGTANSSGLPAAAVFISSDYCNAKNVNINQQPSGLTVEDGKLVWVDDGGNYSDYELLITDSLGNKMIVQSISRSHSLSTLSGEFSSIQVRHYGTVNGAGMSSMYVNSAYNEIPLEKVKKLAQPVTKINENGLFEWNPEDYALNTGVKLNVNRVAAYGGNIIVEKTYDLITGNDNATTVAKNFALEGYVQGSVNGDARVDDYLNINSNAFTMEAWQFAPVTSFEAIRGLKLRWNIDKTTIQIGGEDVTNDRFIIKYTLDGGVNWQTRVVEDLSELPLWDLGNYQATITVRSSGANVIPSTPYHLNSGSPVLFNKFAGGDGSPTNPFIIKTTTNSDIMNGVALENSTAETKMGYINLIPSCYFRLAENVVLTDLAENSLLDNNMPKLYESDILINEATLTGGFDGGNYTISNYQVGRLSENSALWANLYGSDLAGFTEDKTEINFFGRRGVIQNLNLEISRFDLDFSATLESEETPPAYFLAFIAQYSMGGWISKCNVSLASSFGEDGIVKTGIDSARQIWYGGIVGYASSVADSAFSEARVMGCTANVNIQLIKNSSNLQNPTCLGGIVAISSGAKIYNCVNNGKLTATQVGGIAIVSESAGVGGIDYLSTISGCINAGALHGLPGRKGDYSHLGVVGGIVSVNSGHIIYCLNSGDITLSNINYLTEGTTTACGARAGGIAGFWGDTGKLINSLSTARITLNNHVTVEKIGGLIGNNVGATGSVVESASAFYDFTLAVDYSASGGEGTGYGRSTEALKAAGFVSGSTLNTLVSGTYTYYGTGMLKPVFVGVTNGYPTIQWIAS